MSLDYHDRKELDKQRQDHATDLTDRRAEHAERRQRLASELRLMLDQRQWERTEEELTLTREDAKLRIMERLDLERQFNDAERASLRADLAIRIQLELYREEESVFSQIERHGLQLLLDSLFGGAEEGNPALTQADMEAAASESIFNLLNPDS